MMLFNGGLIGFRFAW